MPLRVHQPPKTIISVLRSIETITGQRDRDLLAHTLISTLIELIDGSCFTMYRIVGDEAILAAQACSAPMKTPKSQELSVIIAERADFKIVLDLKHEAIHTLDSGTKISVFPIYGKQDIVALLEVTSYSQHNRDTPFIASFLKVYSNYLALLDESETDTLTGLLNRRTFDHNLEKLLSECTLANDAQLNPHSRRQPDVELPHWLAVMDIDHFKRINDEFGHLYGDEVLLLLSRCMRRNFRQRDRLFRFGGEEFVVVLDRTDLENATRVLERFRTAIEHYDFPQVGRVTISIGFVCLNGIDDPSSLVGRADQALYYAKEHGRNQVCHYEGLLSEGKLNTEHYTDDVQLF